MREQIGFAWRVAATGFCFAAFGIGGVVLALVIIPLATLWPASHGARWRRAQRLVHHGFRTFLRVVEWLGVGRVSVINAERLAHPGRALVLANHPTLLDVVVLVSLMPQADCVVKQALWRNPFLRGVVRAAGYVSNSSPQTLLDDCGQLLTGERALLLFPEGTRTVPGNALHFQRGAARLALHTAAEVLPVTVTCEPPTLMKNAPWYRVPGRAWHIRVMVHERLLPAELVAAEPLPEPAAVRRLTRALETLFERKIDEHERAYQRIEGTADPVAGVGGHRPGGHRSAGGAVR